MEEHNNTLEESSTSNELTTTIEEVQDEQQQGASSNIVSHDSETGETILIERSRNNFSYTKNELRQRNTSKTSDAATIDDNYKNDVNNNGGGFYECNIW